MVRPATNIHRLIVDLWHRSEVEQRFEVNREAVFAEYDLTDEEIQALASPDYEAMGKVGIAPISQLLWSLKAFPPLREHLSMRCHMDRYNAEVLAAVKEGK